MKVNILQFDKNDLITALTSYEPINSDDANNLQTVLKFVNSTSDYCKRSHLAGHMTASAWVMDRDRKFVLLNHHRSLDRWMQLGGHIECDTTIREAALREAIEESGLTSLRLENQEILDIDVHIIPVSKKAPEHVHYDIRFFFTADKSEHLSVSSESKSLSWVPAILVKDYTQENSVLRMLAKATIAH